MPNTVFRENIVKHQRVKLWQFIRKMKPIEILFAIVFIIYTYQYGNGTASTSKMNYKESTFQETETKSRIEEKFDDEEKDRWKCIVSGIAASPVDEQE